MSRNQVRFYGQNSLNGLGLVPAWQFSVDPNINPNINAYMTIPEGWQSQSSPAQPFPISQPICAGTRITAAPQAQAAQLGLPVFDSWWWTHRKQLAIGGAVLAGVGLIAGLGAILR